MVTSKVTWIERLQARNTDIETQKKSKMKKLIPKVGTGCCGCNIYNSSIAIALILLGVFTAGAIYIAYNAPIFIDQATVSAAKRHEKPDLASLKGALYGMLAFFLFNDIPNILLLIGILKKRHRWMLPWIIFYGALLSLYFVFALILLVGVFMSSSMIATFLIYMFVFACIIYFWLVIVTHFREVRKKALGKDVSTNGI